MVIDNRFGGKFSNDIGALTVNDKTLQNRSYHVLTYRGQNSRRSNL